MKRNTGVRNLHINRDFGLSIINIAVPIVLQNLIVMGVNMIDTIMLGTMGEVAIAGSSQANQFIALFQICCMGICMGASVLINRFWGSGNRVDLMKSVTIMLRLIITWSLLFTVVSAIIPNAIIRLYTPDEAVITAGRTYLLWSLPTFLSIGLTIAFTTVLRATSQNKIPVTGSLIACVLNVFLNWVFIFGNLGAPRMEIRGAALGTVIARVLELGFIGGYTFFLDKKLLYKVKHLFIIKCRDIFPLYIKIALPVFVSDALLALGNSAIAVVMGQIGAQFISANAIVTLLQRISSVAVLGISASSAIITGHTLGEGKIEQAQGQGKAFLLIGVGFGFVSGIFILLISDIYLGFYNISPETLALAKQLMWAVAVSGVFHAANSILTKGVLRAGGDTWFLMVADILFLWVLSIPLGYAVGVRMQAAGFIVYMCLKADEVIKSVWCIYRLNSNKWIKVLIGTHSKEVIPGS